MSVNETPYRYLFPYEKIPSGSDIIIYGAGELGQDYLLQMQITQYCHVAAIADRNYEKYPNMIVPVISPERIHEISFDYVVIALRMPAAFHEIKRILELEGVREEKIICIFERKKNQNFIFNAQTLTGELAAEMFAFSKSQLSIAILATGGFGDMVIQKRLVLELIRMAPECRIDFYNIKSMDLLKYLYTDCENINQIIPDLGSRYKINYGKYVLALTIEACHFIKVDKWEYQHFQGEDRIRYHEFIAAIDRLKEETDKENVDISTPPHLTMMRRRYQGLHAYSGFNYNGAFHIKDKYVSIPLDEAWETEFKKEKLERYITVNFGNGDCADNSRIAKSWNREGFEQMIFLFKERYPEIDVVQIGAENSEKLAGVKKYVLGADFRLSLYLLKNSMLHVDIEGGLVHIATQLGTKCVVLFGPTVREYYGYEQNINIQAGNCRNCWGLYSDVNKCARGMKEPECMYSITSEMVMEHIQKYMDSVL